MEKIQVVTVPAASIREYCEEAQVGPNLRRSREVTQVCFREVTQAI